MSHLSPKTLITIATRFKVLAVPARLSILDALRDGALTVTQLGEATGLAQANLSKHLQILHGQEYVKRSKRGLFTYYSVAGRDVYKLCDIMCGRLEIEATAHKKTVGLR